MSSVSKTNETGTISAADWVAAARATLIETGIAGVKVEPLAQALGVTPGSFYWHFSNRSSLHDSLLQNWLATNVAPFSRHYEESVDEPREQYLALAYTWLLSPDFDPPFDVAIREWARTSPKVARLVNDVDSQRIELYESIFRRFGFGSDAATIRARAVYYHQIGYDSMRIEEPLDDRLLLIPHYAMMFTGDDWLRDCQTASQVRRRLTGFRRRKTAVDTTTEDNSEVTPSEL